ncbi:LysR family transcriptional regulator [Tritonibacter scottomollicae]|uniref:LysR family transcriptional regulator n=1 Tax=Tritonibacter scottomollicae TaxID=483013 RepID=UPI003AA86147
MEDPDYLGIDGRQLRILLAIDAAGSLTGAARMLDMNQSTVSYWLDILRKRMDDPLFVRVGNGVEPTERAKALIPQAREVLRHIETMFETDTYHPAQDRGTLRIIATAVERDTLLAPLLHYSLTAAPGLSFEIVPQGSSFQVAEKLRQGGIDFAVMPDGVEPGDGLLQRGLITIQDAVFFDPQYPLTEGDIDAFCDRPQVRIALGPEAGFAIDRTLARHGRTRHVALQVGDFDSALRLIEGTRLIATLPLLLARTGGCRLGHVPPPWPQDGLRLALYWHARNQTSARNAFWRARLLDIAKTLAPDRYQATRSVIC